MIGTLYPSNVDYQAYFYESMRNIDVPLLETLALQTTSTGSEESYHWLAELAGVEEWLGDITLSELEAHKYTIANRDWSVAPQWDKNDERDDKLGLIYARLDAAAQSFGLHKIELLMELLTTGESNACFDGVNFFAATHPTDTGNVSNNINLLLDATNFNLNYAAFLRFVDKRGKKLRGKPTHLVVGPTLLAMAESIVKASVNAAGATNTNFGRVGLICDPAITDSDWYLLDLSKPIKPFIIQDREAVQIDEPVFVNARSRIKFMKAWASYAGGYGLWQMAMRGYP